MFVKDYDIFMASVQHALNLPVRARCAELTVLLDRAKLLELHNFYPILIDSIFGHQGTVCWGLRTITDNYVEDYRQLQHFLSPCGPMFRLIYTLLKESNVKYEYPLLYLPIKIRQLLEASSAVPFYSELINTNVQSRPFKSLLLNPFDYYFFHFAYHLTNPWQQRAGSNVTSWNTVYYALCCDYMKHFLPTDPSVRILPDFYYNGKNPIKQGSPNTIQSSPGQIYPQKTKEEMASSYHHPRNEIWRSETVLTVFCDTWLLNDSVIQSSDRNDDAFASGPMRLHYNELPTGEYIRIIRVLIKELHSFSDSARCDDTYLCGLKRAAVPMVQGKFYIFLRKLIHLWPLDGSFRLLLELWLSYIQPWRYPAGSSIKLLNSKQKNPDEDDVALGIDKQSLHPTRNHLPFIAENLLCYVVIFEQLLPRFCRVDLISPKISLMLYRITKVFDQPKLPDFLREVEDCVEIRGPSSNRKNYPGWTENSPSNGHWSFQLSTPTGPANDEDLRHFQSQVNSASILNSTSTQSGKKWTAMAQRKIFELEGPNFCYKALFTNPPAKEVYELLIQITKSIKQAQEIIKIKSQEEKELYSGFWGSIKYFLQAPMSRDEFSLDDRKKVPLYLEVSLNNLKDMFNIDDEMLIEEEERQRLTTTDGTGFEMSDDFKFLTPQRVRNRVKTIKYEGDPDLQPVRSYESAFLVKLFYQLAEKANERFGPNFNRYYHRSDYWGRFSRQILSPPLTIYRYDKSLLGSPRVQMHLPARISFRFCASYRFIAYLFMGAFVAWLLDYRIEYYLVLLAFIFVLYKMLRALPRDSPIGHGYPTQGFGNISFSDSF